MFKSTFSRTLLNLTIGSTTLYGAGVALSLQNDAFNELFTDNVPLAEEVVDYIQSLQGSQRDYNVANFKEKFGKLDKTLTIPKASGIQSTQIDSIKESPKSNEKVEEIKKQQEIKAVKLPLITLKTHDSQLQQVIEEFNLLVSKINSNELTSSSFDSSNLKEVIGKLDSDLKTLTEEASEKFNLRLKELVSSKENELLGKFTKEFQKNLQILEQQHNAQLINEINKTKETLELNYANQIKLNSIEAQKHFSSIVAKAIDEEREGRLSKFNELNDKLISLENLFLKFDEHLSNAELKSSLQFQLSQLRSKLHSDKIEDLSHEINELNKLATTSKNEVLLSAINAINKDSIKDGLLTQSQLITRFQLLAPELRSAALLPPNAGILGHLSAKFFAFLLLPKEGDVKGKDIESVISRVSNNLSLNKLDDAVEEVSNLKGWSRKLANDWVVESRKRLEVEFLVNLIELESRTLY
ncbi:hypothetical protein WICMUC_002471 [Wickerhamomyces mucosus]|uniref:MICOS complex subunit MIC60 n=1 Tax=Wickerhamomyces mucosus TaxID=1378264 RepID=A0A9P8PQQ7_9ASCO|nr:hypothetical protein WICMUC_002471 [Wickerhamomyces mucosus]